MTLHAWCILAFLLPWATFSVGQGTFEHPSARERAFFRYWLPDASVDGSILAQDIVSAGDVGAGGIELVPFYQYGLYTGRYPPGADWSTYGFGTPAYNTLFKQALEAHRDAGLLMDFALGPNQGQGVPADADDEGLQWDLSPFAKLVPHTSGFNDTVPGWGTGRLIALLSAAIISKENATVPPDVLTPNPTPYTQLVLKSRSTVDLTDQVSSHGQIAMDPTSLFEGAETWIFAFYERKSLRRNVVFPNNASSSIWDHGSYTVDHLSAKGARTTIRFWEDYMLYEGLTDLLREAGQYAWEDSPELVANITWTPGLPAAFKTMHGYDIHAVLPFLMWGNNNLGVQAGNPGPYRVFDEDQTLSDGYQNDYRATLEALYQEHLTALSTGVHESLGVKLRTQVSYNLPMDMAASVPLVDVPECESLGFRDSIDAYRQYVGPAILGDRNIISNEMGAVLGEAYRYTTPMLLTSSDIAFAGGSNRMVLHAQGYTGDYYGTTWPGYTGLQYAFSDSYTNKHPAWENGFSDVMRYLARTQHTQQAGTARIDVAIYHKSSATDISFPTIYKQDDLSRVGYSYVYLTADNFKLPQAKVKRGVLAPSGPSFKALVLTNESSITADVADDVVRYAKAGLPVIIAGTPSYYPSGGSLDSDSQEEKNAFQTLESTRNVYMTSLDEVASKLEALHIQPNVRVEANGLWHSTFRQDQKAKLDYIFILGDKIPTSGSITISSLGYPYLFDPWTGRREPILRYDRTGRGRIAISLGLAANQTSIIAISRQPLHDVPIPDYHLTLLPETVLGYSYSPETGLNVQVGAQSLPSSSSSSSENICLSNGEQVAAPSNSVPQSFELEHWKLTAEHWEAPEDMYDVTVVARKRNTTHDLASPLLPWTELDSQLHNASGVGYYASSFDWPPEGSARGDAPSGAYVSFRGKVQQTLRVSVNGHALQPIDPRAPEIDVGPYLKLGKNNILVVAPTTMWNYLRSILSDIKNAGDPPLTLNVGVTIPVPGPTENGLVGTVHVVPYSNVHV